MRARARPTTKADEIPQFVEFWDAWRPRMNRNDGRGYARDEFFRHVWEYGADPQDIADGAKWFITNGGNDCEQQFRVHSQTWLNRRAYEDGAEQWRELQQKNSERTSNVVSIQSAPSKKTAFQEAWERGEFRNVREG